MKALEAFALVAANAACGQESGVGRRMSVAFCGVTPVGLRQLLAHFRVVGDESFEPGDAPGGLETRYPLVGQRTGEPVPGGEWSAIVEYGRDRDHDR
jgi:hypothetical protein